MNVIFVIYILIGVLFSVVAMSIVDKNDREIDEILGLFGDRFLVVLAVIAIGVFWPIALFVIVKRVYL